MFKSIVFIILLSNIFFEIGIVYGGTEAEMRELLFAKLNSSDYSPRVRPIKDTGNTLTLTVDMYLVSINRVEEVEQKITTTAYLKIVWSDTFMTWEPTDYGNITEFSLPQNEIWKPDIALANAYDSITGLGDKFMYVTVKYDGKITWEPFQRFVSICSLEMKYFPFDTHLCNIQMATWSSTKQMINIVPGTDGFNIDSFEENANWNLLNVSTFDSSTLATSGLAFSMTIRRKPIFYILNTIIPVILLSVLNNFVFVLSCSSGEKLSFAIILFLSFAIFLLIITEIMPEGITSIPVITIYLILESVFSTFIVLVSIIQLRLHNRENKSPLPKVFKQYTETIQNIKRLVCFDVNKTVGEAEKGDDVQVKTPINSIEETFHDTNLETKARNDKEQKKTSNNTECSNIIKRKLVCGANKVDSIDDTSDDTWNNRLSRMSDKTTFRLADILGKSNKVEPDAYFNKPTQVVSLYDQNLAVEDVDDNDITKLTSASETVFTSPRTKQLTYSESGSETSSVKSEDKKTTDEITWSEFVLALDNTFFILFIIINTITTAVTFFVSMAN
ncbi:acetylcholine receptor subunit alpha-like [Mercenaria mercenaria]|uniref:acetylcholine receptor subunit alpha-like n=1 Tax=Mercenaria mercenaria TaxID=6596 RepID=UPI00234F31EB|nr:acetylcholine receptor subunit alpha-like [Mercenaria mercenaria]